MIRRLRRQFIITNLVLVGLVLAVVFGILVVTNVQRLADQSQINMRAALNWEDGEIPPRFEFKPPARDRDDRQRDDSFSIVPVFVVTIEDGAVISVNDGGQVEVSSETAQQAAQQALESGNQGGILRDLGLRFLMQTDEDGTVRIAFADRTWELSSIRTLVLSCLLVGGLAMVGFFFISLLLSALALRPAERAWQQQRQFVADASHELKTPLTVILANTGIVLSHRSDPVEAQSKWLEYTQEEAVRMKKLVEDLLFLAKSDDARTPLNPRSISMSDLTTACLLLFESVAFEANVQLHSSIAPDLTLTGDEGQLRRLVMILLDNGVKYAGAEGTVTLTLSRQQDKIRLSVHNTGEPIPAQHIPHLFERFYRSDSSRVRSQGGYGLGLAIAKSIVETHRGKIFVTSTAQAGTEFTVLLPRKFS